MLFIFFFKRNNDAVLQMKIFPYNICAADLLLVSLV